MKVKVSGEVKNINLTSGLTQAGDNWEKMSILLKTGEGKTKEYILEVTAMGQIIDYVHSLGLKNGSNAEFDCWLSSRVYEGPNGSKTFTSVSIMTPSGWMMSSESEAVADDSLPF